MINYLEELNKIFSTLSPDFTGLLEKDIVLYGAGSLGHMAMDLLSRVGIKPKYIVDAKAEGFIKDVQIIKPDLIKAEDKKNSLFVICISTIPYDGIVDFLKSIGIRYTLQFYTYYFYKAPDLLGNGWTYFNPSEEDKKAISSVCELLIHDDLSLAHYLTFLWWKVCYVEKVYTEFPILSGKKYWTSPNSFNLTDHEVFVDCGSHFGQSIEGFIKATSNKFEIIYAFEPDEENLEICKSKFNDSRIQFSTTAISDFSGDSYFDSGLGYASKLSDNSSVKCLVKTIDSLNINPTLIKLHIEGTELMALKGAQATIQKYKPKILCLADHNIDGLINIPLFLKDNGYKLYFNLHDYCGNSAVWYAINETIIGGGYVCLVILLFSILILLQFLNETWRRNGKISTACSR